MDEKGINVGGVMVSQEHVAVTEGTGAATSSPRAKAKVVHNAELYAAIQETKIDYKSRNSLHLYFAVLVAFCCACANGYDGSLLTGIVAMSHFQDTFHSGKTGTIVAIMFSLYTVGAMVGSPFGAMLSDKYGRRAGMFCGCSIIIVGMIIASTAFTIAQFVVGRFVLGFGISIVTVAAPAYSVEIPPPHWRGRSTGFYNCGWFGGAIPAAAVVYGCNKIDNDYSWRIPLIVQAFACIFVLFGVWFIPESPRFLMANGREEEAIDFLAKYHGNGDRNSKLVQLEIEEMKEGIRQDGIDKRPLDYRPFLFSHSGRWRILQVLMISIFGQFSGNGLGYFNTTIFEIIGVSSIEQQLAYNLLNSVLSAVGALTAVAYTDTMPRRKVLIIGTLACVAALATNSGLSAALEAQGEHIQDSYAKGALASYFLFNIVFSFTYTPLQGVIPTEALETTTRAKGLAFSSVIVYAMGFINQFAGPIALGNIGYKYIYVFVGWDLVETVLWYFFGVESQGRTLEQLEWVYNQPNPVKASLKVDRVIVEADGRVKEKVVTSQA
ncbi:general substrate transporter [Annulohypoxylon truncatum]|uniref:general substrate transporter n=1 Tax=Annulohypoxylon truncatum TaxID=327061 RepID=UPI002008CACE|nr:general substrate transporter [Annulohypoxylon truncatum]KAI1208558.1 general substrate transporter [Annulohypoxylon truncatum]